MAAETDWELLENTLAAAARVASGLPVGKVLWEGQTLPSGLTNAAVPGSGRPAPPYLTLFRDAEDCLSFVPEVRASDNPAAVPGHDAGTKAARESPCACGPVDLKAICTVTDSEGTRAARPGEHLAAGTWSGACVPKQCYEHAAIQALGSAMPSACGGRNYGAKVDAPAPAEKVIADPAVEAGEVKLP